VSFDVPVPEAGRSVAGTDTAEAPLRDASEDEAGPPPPPPPHAASSTLAAAASVTALHRMKGEAGIPD
jgi:hypothetical protein